MKRGFTLVELIAVIIILVVLMTIGIPSVMMMITKQKEKEYNKAVESIKYAAELYVQANRDSEKINKLVEPFNFVLIKLETLLKEGYLEEINNPKTDELFDKKTMVKVYLDANKIFQYEYPSNFKYQINLGKNKVIIYYDGGTIKKYDLMNDVYLWDENNNSLKENITMSLKSYTNQLGKETNKTTLNNLFNNLVTEQIFLGKQIGVYEVEYKYEEEGIEITTVRKIIVKTKEEPTISFEPEGNSCYSNLNEAIVTINPKGNSISTMRYKKTVKNAFGQMNFTPYENVDPSIRNVAIPLNYGDPTEVTIDYETTYYNGLENPTKVNTSKYKIDKSTPTINITNENINNEKIRSTISVNSNSEIRTVKYAIGDYTNSEMPESSIEVSDRTFQIESFDNEITYTIYVENECGVIKKQKFTTSGLDREGPSVTVEPIAGSISKFKITIEDAAGVSTVKRAYTIDNEYMCEKIPENDNSITMCNDNKEITISEYSDLVVTPVDNNIKNYSVDMMNLLYDSYNKIRTFNPWYDVSHYADKYYSNAYGKNIQNGEIYFNYYIKATDNWGNTKTTKIISKLYMRIVEDVGINTVGNNPIYIQSIHLNGDILWIQEGKISDSNPEPTKLGIYNPITNNSIIIYNEISETVNEAFRWNGDSDIIYYQVSKKSGANKVKKYYKYNSITNRNYEVIKSTFDSASQYSTYYTNSTNNPFPSADKLLILNGKKGSSSNNYITTPGYLLIINDYEKNYSKVANYTTFYNVGSSPTVYENDVGESHYNLVFRITENQNNYNVVLVENDHRKAGQTSYIFSLGTLTYNLQPTIISISSVPNVN